MKTRRLFVASLFLLGAGHARAMKLSDIISQATGIIETNGSSGSAVVVGYSEDSNQRTYVALTSSHVVNCIKGVSSGSTIYIPTASRKRYSLLSCLNANATSDISIVTFKADLEPRTLPVIVRYDRPSTESYFKAGDFNSVANSGRVSGYSLQTEAIPTPLFRSIHFQFQSLLKSNAGGYSLVYPASTVPGMSGGPVIGVYACPGTSKFYPSVIGVHGRSEDYPSGGRSGISLGVPASSFDEAELARHGVVIDNEGDGHALRVKNVLCSAITDPWN